MTCVVNGEVFKSAARRRTADVVTAKLLGRKRLSLATGTGECPYKCLYTDTLIQQCPYRLISILKQ